MMSHFRYLWPSCLYFISTFLFLCLGHIGIQHDGIRFVFDMLNTGSFYYDHHLYRFTSFASSLPFLISYKIWGEALVPYAIEVATFFHLLIPLVGVLISYNILVRHNKTEWMIFPTLSYLLCLGSSDYYLFDYMIELYVIFWPLLFSFIFALRSKFLIFTFYLLVVTFSNQATVLINLGVGVFFIFLGSELKLSKREFIILSAAITCSVIIQFGISFNLLFLNPLEYGKLSEFKWGSFPIRSFSFLFLILISSSFLFEMSAAKKALIRIISFFVILPFMMGFIEPEWQMIKMLRYNQLVFLILILSLFIFLRNNLNLRHIQVLLVLITSFKIVDNYKVFTHYKPGYESLETLYQSHSHLKGCFGYDFTDQCMQGFSNVDPQVRFYYPFLLSPTRELGNYFVSKYSLWECLDLIEGKSSHINESKLDYFQINEGELFKGKTVNTSEIVKKLAKDYLIITDIPPSQSKEYSVSVVENGVTLEQRKSDFRFIYQSRALKYFDFLDLYWGGAHFNQIQDAEYKEMDTGPILNKGVSFTHIKDGVVNSYHQYIKNEKEFLFKISKTNECLYELKDVFN